MPALPTQLDSFVGRDDELAEVGRLLTQARLLTIVGPGGAGKTRLAMELAARVGAAGSDQIWLVDLTSVGGDVPAQVVAAAIGIRAAPAEGLLEAVAAVLDKPGLLVIDNCEHVVDEAAALVDALLRRCPALRALATSQEVLGVPGEVVFPLGGLAVVATPRPSGAVRLFSDRARESRPDFVLTPLAAAEVAQICARLDGLPLCVELAARWVRSLSTTEILRRLDDRFALLTSSARTVPERHRSLRAVVEWSYHLLDERERAALRCLAALPGGFDLDGAAAVIGDADALHLVDQIQAKSLLVRTETARGTTRFRLIESIRLYAEERLVATGEVDAVHERATAWLTSLCAPLADEVFQNEPLLSRIDEERDNLVPAIERALADGDSRASMLATGLAACWRRLGWVDRGRALLERVPNRDVTAVNLAAFLVYDQGDYELARKLANEVVDTERSRGASVPVIRALLTLSFVADDLGDYATTERHLAECVRLAEKLGRPMVTMMLRQNLAWAVLQSGDMARAEAMLAELLPVFRRIAPEPAMLSGMLHTLGVLALKSGDLDRAERYFREDVAVSPKDLLGIRYGLDGLAVVAAARGDGERALRLAAAVEALAEGSPPMIGVGWKQEVEEAIERARVAFGAARADVAWGEGGRLTVEEVTRYALHGAWPAGDGGEHALSPREREVARLVADGLTNREIAGRLGLSSRTVDSHLEHIRTKLGLRSRAQVAAWAASNTAD